jgi:hypothetical protein
MRHLALITALGLVSGLARASSDETAVRQPEPALELDDSGQGGAADATDPSGGEESYELADATDIGPQHSELGGFDGSLDDDGLDR